MSDHLDQRCFERDKKLLRCRDVVTVSIKVGDTNSLLLDAPLSFVHVTLRFLK